MSKPAIEAEHVNRITPIIPDNPDAIAWFLRDAANYVAYIEDMWLGKLIIKKDELKNKVSAIESAMKIRRDEYIGIHLVDIPKEFQKNVASVTQYVDYTIFGKETKKDVAVLVELRQELADVRSKITAWTMAVQQYERAITASTMILSWKKMSLKHL